MTGRAAIDGVLRRATDTGAVPGVVAMATDGTDTIYRGAFGERSLGGGTAMTADTVFWIASMTKALTGAACMQLVEQGRVGLDNDTGPLVPALAAPRVLEKFDAAGQPVLRPAKRAITLRHLLTHTAGFVYDTWNEGMLAYMRHTGLPRLATFQKPEHCLPLAFDPGDAWEYGVNIDWAGKVLEAVTGQTLDAYLQQHLLAPLGMSSTGYRLRPDVSARLAGMHQRHPDGHLEPIEDEVAQDPEGFLGGGGMYSTAGDYLRFIMMLLNGGALDGVRVLQPQTVALMGENHIGALDVAALPTTMPLRSNDAEFFPGMRKKWGLSFLINTEAVPGGRSAGSLCWAGLRNTYYWIDPTRRVGGTLMTQILPFADPTVLGLLEEFERGVYGLADARAAA
ncbi:MAG: beta-lactamase family protein [Acidisphaera sp.]|nr:beta-lactamase family protein [Acidisphaera sp.]